MSTPVAAHERIELTDGWELARSPAGLLPDAGAIEGLSWRPARVPGTVAGSLPVGASVTDPDTEDWWFRTRFDAEAPDGDERVLLALGGLATIAEVYLNGDLVLESESMFASHEVDVGDRLREANELAICCRALAPRLRERRTPRARWRTRLVTSGNLRFYRTMLLGRTPGFAPAHAVVGPWRPVALERRHGVSLEAVRLRARVDDGDGRLECTAAVSAPSGRGMPDRLTVSVEGHGGAPSAELALDPGSRQYVGTVTVPAVELWWPHTHGEPTLYDVRIRDGAAVLHKAPVGFRRLQTPADLEGDGLAVRINGAPVFVRGAIWTPLNLRAPHAGDAELRPVLEAVVSAGMNMLRIPGIGAYESDEFYALCDELGILVWQDFMFANLDYPAQDREFLRAVESEVRGLLDRLGPRPSLTVLCGGSEIAQQVAMLGLDPALAEGPLFGELLPGLVAEADVDAPYIPSTPWGGELPFRTDRGVANYYGVGAYLRPLGDARRSEVKFAAESLAFANVPDAAALADLEMPGGASVTHPAWKAGVPRDPASGWDFDDVRDHYLGLLCELDPVALRRVDQERYLELSRMVTGEVMAETFGEWRRPTSTCHGALVLWLKDLVPGAGWGLLDHRGTPKVAYHHLRRALAPVAVWATDEGLGGVAIHVANDRPAALTARLRIALYRDSEILVDESLHRLELAPRACITHNLEALLGRFVDASWAYRFGPPPQDLIAISLEEERDGTARLVSQAFRFPAGRPLSRLAADQLGLHGQLEEVAGGGRCVRVATRRFAYGVRVIADGYVAGDDAFGVEPGHERVIPLTRATPAEALPTAAASLTALNLTGRLGLSML